MSKQRTPIIRETRRDRRAAARVAAKAPLPEKRRGRRPSGFLLATFGALAAGAVIVTIAVAPWEDRSLIKTPAVLTPADASSGMVAGDSAAPITVAVYEDFQCPACGQFEETIRPSLLGAYVRTGKARLESKPVAILGEESLGAAVAASCAADEGKFWPYHDYLYANQGRAENDGAFVRSRLVAIAAKVGLDASRFGSCLDDPARAEQVKADTKAAADRGVTKTPTLFVNAIKLEGVGDWKTLESALTLAGSISSPSPDATSGSSPTPGATGGSIVSPSPTVAP